MLVLLRFAVLTFFIFFLKRLPMVQNDWGGCYHDKINPDILMWISIIYMFELNWTSAPFAIVAIDWNSYQEAWYLLLWLSYILVILLMKEILHHMVCILKTAHGQTTLRTKIYKHLSYMVGHSTANLVVRGFRCWWFLCCAAEVCIL